MKTMVKETSLFLTGLMLCTLGVQTGFALNDAYADTVEASTTATTDTTTDPWAGVTARAISLAFF